MNKKALPKPILRLTVALNLLPFCMAMVFVGSVAPSAQASSSSIGSLTLTGVYPRIFTPNGDGANDKAVFHFSNPEQLPISGKIFDLPGAQVATLVPGSDSTSELVWDGKDSDGRVVPGGIYLYEIDFQGQSLTGTVVVAR